ncbi:MAG: hypothetical protein LBS31_07855 [Candidatus Adiutrix sp.]|jgi:hypothetical protein|nr:hypothetical protein [Candidatus Adiutrix sp.]
MTRPDYQPLTQASRVLKLETISRLCKCPSLNRRGLSILDYLAASEPERLKELEAAPNGSARLAIRLLDLQGQIDRILGSPEEHGSLATAEAAHELLKMNEVTVGL